PVVTDEPVDQRELRLHPGLLLIGQLHQRRVHAGTVAALADMCRWRSSRYLRSPPVPIATTARRWWCQSLLVQVAHVPHPYTVAGLAGALDEGGDRRPQGLEVLVRSEQQGIGPPVAQV